MGTVYIVIKGGLGNQLFQAALGVALENHLGVEVRHLTDSFARDEFGRTFLLDRFPNLTIRRAPAEEAKDLPTLGGFNLSGDKVVEHVQSHPAVVLNSWWQRESFFLGQHDAIRRAFEMRPDAALTALGKDMRAGQAIGAHVRRTDYGHFGLVRASYYLNAIAQIRSQVGERRVVFFTDEPNFCRHMFKDVPAMNVFQGSLANPLADFYLLSRCAHFVIANSTFSWWAAWLGRDEASIIHAPSPWQLSSGFDPAPPDWRRTPNALVWP